MAVEIVDRKPRKCPVCGNKVAEILYGIPVHPEKVQKEIDAERIILGGCILHADMPDWQCVKCGQQYMKRH